MKGRLLILTLSLLVVWCGSSFGEEAVTVESITGLTADGGTKFADGDVITVRIRAYNNNEFSEPLAGCTNGFVIKSESAVATWTTATIIMNPAYNWDNTTGSPYFFDLFNKQCFRCTGDGADTIAFGGVKLFGGTGLPFGFDDWACEITLGPVAGETDKIILDSSFFQPAGTWLWGLGDGTRLYPTWDGPHDILGRLYTGVGDAMGSALPTSFGLKQNYPNPFNPTTDILFELPVKSRVKIDIFNILGQKVRSLVDETRNAGYHVVQWDGADNNGSGVSSGVYFCKMQAGDFVESRKMMMLK